MIKTPKYEKGSIGWLREKAKEQGFGDNIGEYIKWARKNGELPNITDINRKDYAIFKEKFLEKGGYNQYEEYRRESSWNKGIRSPMSETEDCSAFLGSHIAERKISRIILPRILGNIKKEMPYGNHGFDFLIEGDIKVDVMSKKRK